MTTVTGSSVGFFRLEAELGSGGMGVVYRATPEQDTAGVAAGTRVALKVLHPHLIRSDIMRARFARECEIGQGIVHPNVVRMFGSGENDGFHYIVMEYVEGQTLRDLIVELQVVPEELCRHIACEVAAGVAAIHEAGAVHRDIKPENVLITPDHQVRLMDLGVARLVDETTRLSLTGSFVGSVQYAAPEQFRGGDEIVDPRVDQHAMGVLFYEMACGRNPFLDTDVSSTMRRVLLETPAQLRDVNRAVSPFLSEVVRVLIAKKCEDRFASIQVVHELLTEAEESIWWQERESRVEGLDSTQTIFFQAPVETALYGRDDELAKMQALYEHAREGDGQVALLLGETGIGKTRLAEEVVNRVRQSGEEVNFLYGGFLPGGARDAGAGFASAFREHLGPAGSAPYLTETPRLAPAFDALLHGDRPPDGQELLTTASIQTCFVHVARSLAAERPTVIVVDDLDLAGDDSLRLFTSLALAVSRHRLLLIGALRRRVDTVWLSETSAHPHVTTVPLGRLGPRSLTDLLSDYLQSPALAATLGVPIAMRSEGNPHFVFEILRGLEESRVLTRDDDGVWRTTGDTGDIRIPSSLRDLVSRRIEELEPEDRELLDAAACAGFRLDPSLVADALGMPAIRTLKQFARIEKQHRLVRSVGREIMFDHDQVQVCLLDELMPQLKELYHAALGEALQRRMKVEDLVDDEQSGSTYVRLVEHFLSGGRGDLAKPYLSAALEHLEGAHALDRGAALLTRALTVDGLLEHMERIEALIRLGGWLSRLGRAEAALDRAREAEALARTQDAPDMVSRAALLGGNTLRRAHRHDEARISLSRAVEAAREGSDRGVEAAAMRGLAQTVQSIGQHDAALELFDRDRRLVSEVGDPALRGEAMSARAGVLLELGRREAALEEYRDELRLVKSRGDSAGEAAAMRNVGRVLVEMGRVDEARDHLVKSLTISRSIGDREGELTTVELVGRVHLLLGQFTDARTHFERQAELAHEIGSPLDGADATGNLGLVLMTQGRGDHAFATFDRQLERSLEIEHRAGEARAQVQIASALRVFGAVDRAHARFVRAVAMVCEQHDRLGEGNALCEYGRFQLDLTKKDDQVDGIAVLFDQAIECLTGVEDHIGLSRALRFRAKVASRSGDAQTALLLLARATEHALRSGVIGADILIACDIAAMDAAAPAGTATSHDMTALLSLRERVRSMGERLPHLDRMEACFRAGTITADAELIAESAELLEFFSRHAPDELRRTTVTHVPLHRAIAHASRRARSRERAAR